MAVTVAEHWQLVLNPTVLIHTPCLRYVLSSLVCRIQKYNDRPGDGETICAPADMAVQWGSWRTCECCKSAAHTSVVGYLRCLTVSCSMTGGATWRMLLKRHRRRLRCRFGQFRWPLRPHLPWQLARMVSYWCSIVTTALKCTVVELLRYAHMAGDLLDRRPTPKYF